MAEMLKYMVEDLFNGTKKRKKKKVRVKEES